MWWKMVISVEVEVQKQNEVSIKNLTELRAFSLPIYVIAYTTQLLLYYWIIFSVNFLS